MASGSGSCSKREWVVEVEKTLMNEADTSVDVSRWQRHSIYRVPESIKDRNPKAYQPHVVSLGPLHHGDAHLQPMEEHKRRAVRHFLRRAKKPLEEFVTAVDDVMEQLQSAYVDLDAKWLDDDDGKEKFLEMMIVDGCFLLELMRAAGPGEMNFSDYAPNDSIFSRHGMLYVVPYIRRDMLMLENQLPLLLLAKLVSVERAKAPNDEVINRMVLRFLSPVSRLPPPSVGLGLHPLEVYRRSMLYGPYQAQQNSLPETHIIKKSAVELFEAGIRFRKSTTHSLHDIRFQRGELRLPAVCVDDSTEYMLLNMIAFELLHVGAGNDVTGYVFFMDNIIRSDKDVALLSYWGIVQNAIGSDNEVAKLFHDISKYAVLEPNSALDAVQRQVIAHSFNPWNIFFTNLRVAYFGKPVNMTNLVAAVIALFVTILQTIYAMASFYESK